MRIKALDEQMQLQQEEHENTMFQLQWELAAEKLALDDDVLLSDTDSQPVGQPVTGDGGTDEEPTLREMDEEEFAEWLQGPDLLDDLES